MPEEKPRLFISHSSRDTEAAKAVRKALSGLFEIFLDCDVIRTGDDWRSEIEQALLECDVGLVLASEQSAESQWVPAEAFMLGVRLREIDPSMKVVPIFLDGYSPEKLKDAPWNPAALGTMNGLPLVSGQGKIRTQQLEKIVDDLRQWSEEVAERSPHLHEVEQYLAGKLKGLNSQPRIAQALGIEQQGRRFLNHARWLAGKILRVHDLVKFNEVILEIKTMDSLELARELVEKLSPYCWIDPDLARALNAKVLSPRRPKPSVGLVAEKERTPRACVQRASERVVKAWKLWPVKGDWDHADTLDYLVDEVMSHLRQAKIVVDPAVVEPDDAVRMMLRMYLDVYGEVVVLLPKEFALEDRELLADLNAAFLHLTFMLATDAEDPTLVERFDDFHPLPAIDPQAETLADFFLRTAEQLLGVGAPPLAQP